MSRDYIIYKYVFTLDYSEFVDLKRKLKLLVSPSFDIDFQNLIILKTKFRISRKTTVNLILLSIFLVNDLLSEPF